MCLYVSDLLSVWGIGRSCCSHRQQLDGRGGVTENIRYLLGHHLLHVLPQVLEEAENVECFH